jgi:hypothetical protein
MKKNSKPRNDFSDLDIFWVREINIWVIFAPARMRAEILYDNFCALAGVAVIVAPHSLTRLVAS